MIQNISAGDKLTCIKVNSMAGVFISEITVDGVNEGRIIFTQKRKQYAYQPDSSMIILKGHNLGVKRGTWGKKGCEGFMMDAKINVGGLNREAMIEMLKTNINPAFNDWRRIRWYDGTSEKGDPIFEPRPVSEHYLKHQETAEGNREKQASELNVGDFIYTYLKGSKHQHLMDMLDFHLDTEMNSKEYPSLGKIVDIVDVSDAQFSSFQYSAACELLTDRGGDFSDDIAEDRDVHNLSDFERKTFYAHLTLLRTPTGRAITVDSQGHDYMRYTGLLMHYRESMADDCAKARAVIDVKLQEKAQEQHKAEIAQEQENRRIDREYSYLTLVTERYDKKSTANNLRKVLKKEFPTTQFSVTNNHSSSYDISWVDGPTVEMVEKFSNLFVGTGFDGMTDSTIHYNSYFMDKFGYLGYVSTHRNVSEDNRIAAMNTLNADMGTSFGMKDYIESERAYMSDLVYRHTRKIDYTVKPTAATKAKSETVTAIVAEGIEIVPDYSEKAFAIIGNTKEIKETLKSLGGRFNPRLTCGTGWIFSKTKLVEVKLALNVA